jgi:hypothetical protein
VRRITFLGSMMKTVRTCEEFEYHIRFMKDENSLLGAIPSCRHCWHPGGQACHRASQSSGRGRRSVGGVRQVPGSFAQRTIGYWRSVFPHSLMSAIHLWCDSTSLADRPMTLTLRFSKSAARRETSASSVVQTGVKSSGCE